MSSLRDGIALSVSVFYYNRDEANRTAGDSQNNGMNGWKKRFQVCKYGKFTSDDGMSREVETVGAGPFSTFAEAAEYVESEQWPESHFIIECWMKE